MDKTPNKFHALQLFTDTFAAETVHLTNEQVGIYIRLLCFAWTKNTKPFTTESAYRICQCRSKECESMVDLVLKEFFQLVKSNISLENQIEIPYDQWTHKRLTAEHEYLTDKYQRRSSAGKKGAEARYNANGKTIAPIPSPNPIPNNYNRRDYDESFEKLWNLLTIKKGSKNRAFRLWLKCNTEMPQLEKTAEIYNKQQKGKDAQFVPHFATWIYQKRWEIQEQDENFKELNMPTLIDRMRKLGYTHRGSEGEYEQFYKDEKNYRIHKFKKEAEIELET